MLPAEPSTPCVLLIEDDLALRQSLCIELEKEKVDVDVAEDGAEAVRLLGIRTYQVVLMDLNLPRISGAELLDRFAMDPGMHQGRIILLANDQATADSATRWNRVEQTFVKPVDGPRVAQAVRKHCQIESA